MLKKLRSLLTIPLDDPSGEVVVAVPFKAKVMHDLSWLVLFCYTLLILNPVMPIVADVMAHTFWEKEHMMTVHKEGGKFHVHWDLVRNARQADKDKSGKSSKLDSDDLFHILPKFTYSFANYHTIVGSYIAYEFFRPTSYTNIDLRPPRVT